MKTDWQAIITAAITDTIGASLQYDWLRTNLPDWDTVCRAIDDAKLLDATVAYVDAIKEACRVYGIDPQLAYNPPPIPTRQFDWCAYDGNDDGEEGQLRGYGRTKMEAIHGLLQEAREKFE